MVLRPEYLDMEESPEFVYHPKNGKVLGAHIYQNGTIIKLRALSRNQNILNYPLSRIESGN